MRQSSATRMWLPLLIPVLTAFAILAGCDTSLATGRVFYVSSDGSDTAAGDYYHPWASFERAVAELQPGDTLLVRGGVYTERLILYEQSGVEGLPIVLSAFAGEEVILDGEGIEIEGHFGGLINVNRSDHVVIRGFTVRNSNGQGIQANYGSFLTIEGNYTYNTYSSGIMAWEVENLVIRDNEIEEFCTSGRGGVEGFQEGLSVSEADGFEIVGNEVHHGYMEGIDAKVGSKNGIIAENHVHHTLRVGIYIDSYDTDGGNIDVYHNIAYENATSGITVCSEEGGINSDVRVFGNTCYRNGSGIIVAGWGGEPPHPVKQVRVHGNVCYLNKQGIVLAGGDGAYLEDIRLYNNIIYRNTAAGIALWGWYGNKPQTVMEGVHIVNNTIVENGASGSWGAGGIHTQDVMVENLVIRNNILDSNELFTISIDEPMTEADYTIEYNLLNGFRNNTNPHNEVSGNHAVIDQDPLFVDRYNFDFSLQSSSPAIDAGTTTEAPDMDFDGSPRPQGDRIDIGAYEYGG